ncbi:MAG TPA: type II secretion system protein GspJ [Gammaproteobacteria bacterium]|nr:type II secretion system protein GspJ [Gammaproteobacteria bacterium]
MIRSHRGFTLLELLVSLSIFALIGVMAYSGLQTVMQQQHSTEAASQRLADLQKAYRIMQRDLEQIVSRKIRNEYGDSVDELVGGRGFTGVEFSRAGYPNPAGFLRSDLQRVAYVPDQDVLLRQTWRVLDRAQDSLPDEQVLVEGINRFTMRFLNASNQWVESWPATPGPSGSPESLPQAVEVELELERLGVVNWIFRLPQTFVAGAQQQGAGNAADEGEGEGEGALGNGGNGEGEG